MINRMNPFMLTDGYKTSHEPMYPKGLEYVYSNFTPRHGGHSNVKGSTGIISFGQQMVMRQIDDIFNEYFFLMDREEVLDEIKREYSLYLGFDYDVDHIAALWDIGFLPIKVKALPEGSTVPYGVPVLTIVNTDPTMGWITNFLETLISNLLWMPMTSATTARAYKQILTKACLKTDKDAIEFVDFQGHNFGMRGMAGIDATIYSGMGHSTSFKGDDSLPTVAAAREYYDARGFVVGSVPASEHSVMSAGGADEGEEVATFRRLMAAFPTGVLSIVSDTWNLWDVLTKHLPILKDEIMARDGKIVIRPDSGNPVNIICGENSAFVGDENLPYDVWNVIDRGSSEQQYKGVIELLWDLFGGTTNAQGYKVLDPHIGAIYGDSITLERAQNIVDRLEAKGFASTNVVLGIGSFTYQYVTRDTHGFAMKATQVVVNGVPKDIFKDPITDDGTKKSAKGLLRVYLNREEGHYGLLDQVTRAEESGGELREIYVNGTFEHAVTFEEVRDRINAGLWL